MQQQSNKNTTAQQARSTDGLRRIGGAYEAVVYNWPYVQNADGTFTSFERLAPDDDGTIAYALDHLLRVTERAS